MDLDEIKQYFKTTENSLGKNEPLQNGISQPQRQGDIDMNGVENSNLRLHRAHSTADCCLDANSDVLLRTKRDGVRRKVFSAVVAPQNCQNCIKSISTTDLQSLNKYRRKANKNKNDNMVLQLVVPASSQNTLYESNYSTGSSTFDIDGQSHLKGHQISSLNEEYSSHTNGVYINGAYSSSELNGYSPKSFELTPKSSLYGTDNPTPQERKQKAFVTLLTKTLSIFYALFNVTLGLAVYVSDIVDGSHPTAELFSLLLVTIAFTYIVYLTVDIGLYMNQKAKYDKFMERNMSDDVEMKQTPEGHFQFNIVLPKAANLGKSMQHHYCFNKDRHSANFYLKVGAAGFCFGHLIHSGLLLGYRIIFLTSDEYKFYDCASVPTLILDFLYPLYSFWLLFFMFKYSNIIINRNIVLARFGIMHCLSASICFWVWTIFRETIEAIANKGHVVDPKITFKANNVQTDPLLPYALPITTYNQGAQILTEYANISLRRFTEICNDNDESLSTIYKDFSPYLYPFSVEYSILVVGVLYLIWQNIAICQEGDEDYPTRQCNTPEGVHENTESNVVVHADCQSSNKGLFGGFIVLVLTIVSSILFFIAIYVGQFTEERGQIGITVNIITSLTVLSLMMVACIFGYRQITKLDLNTAHHNLLDDVLLFICIPAYFLNGIFGIIPALIYQNVIGGINIVLEVLQVLVQTVFLLDGVRRSSDTKELRKKKPGRELVTFLVIANIAIWLMQTFEVKAHGMQDNRYEFYGKELWTILGHMCLPLMMFYRFHSSVCFGDIWKYSYEPSGH